MYTSLTRLLLIFSILISTCTVSRAAITTSPTTGFITAGDSVAVTVTFGASTTEEVQISVDGLGTAPGAGGGTTYSAVFIAPTGVHVETVGVTAVCADGQSETSTAGFKIDSIDPPTPTISDPVDGDVIYEAGDVQIDIEGAVLGGPTGAASVVIMADGMQVGTVSIGDTDTTFTNNFTMPAGKNSMSIQIFAIDAAGNTSELSETVTISRDSTGPPAPTVSSVTPPEPIESDVVALDEVVVSFDTSPESNVAQIYLILNGVAQTPEDVVEANGFPVSPHTFTEVPFPLDVLVLSIQAVVIDGLGQHSQPSAVFEVHREDTPAQVLKIDVDDEDGWVKRKRIKLTVHFNEAMDQSEAHEPTMFLQCQGEESFGALLPIAVEGSWLSAQTWEVKVDITGPSQSIDGEAKVRIQQCHDLTGNGLATPIVSDVTPKLQIDTTGPEPVVDSINPDPDTEKYPATRDFTVPCTDNVLDNITGIGVGTEELELWVDFDGDGLFASEDGDNPPPYKERFTFATDASTGILSWTGTEIRFDPTKTSWEAYRADPVTVRLVMLKDTLGNELTTPVEWDFEIDTSTLAGPSVEYVSWGEVATTTPPEGAHTKDNQQDVVISISPDPVTMAEIDVDSILLKVNGVNYGIKDTDSTYANDGLTMEAPTGEIKLTFKPESVSPEAVTFADGTVIIEIKNVKDAMGQTADALVRKFMVDTVSPALSSSVSPMLPPSGGVVFRDTAPPVSPTLKVVDASGAELDLTSLEVKLETNGGDLSSQFQISSVYESSTGTTILTLGPSSANTSVSLSNGDYKVTFSNIADQAGNTLADVSWEFYVRADMYINYMLFTPNPTPLTSTSMEVEVRYAMQLPGGASPVTFVMYNSTTGGYETQSLSFSGQTQKTSAWAVKLNANYESLTQGQNEILGYLVDSMGNQTNASQNKAATVDCDQSAPPIPGPYLDPVKDIYTGKVTVKWAELTNASLYDVQISTDAGGNSPIQSWTTTSSFVGLTLPDKPHSTYYVRVRSADQAGNWSVLSSPVHFTVDHTAPEALSITVEDPTPNSSNTPVFPNSFESGEILVRVHFSEAMDTDVDMGKDKKVRIMLNSREIKDITKGEWVSTNVWVGSTDPNFIPAELRASGQLTVLVHGAKDKAGNELEVSRSSNFYIQSRPKFKTPMVFPNPLDTNDLIINVETEDGLESSPAIWVSDTQIEVFSYSDRHFAGVYRLGNATVGTQNIRVSGQNDQGNVGHWPETQEELLDASSVSSASSPSRFQHFVVADLNAGEKAYSHDGTLMMEMVDNIGADRCRLAIMPYDIGLAGETADNATAKDAFRAPGNSPSSELIQVGPAHLINISGNTNGKYRYSASLDEKLIESMNISTDKIGLYRFNGKSWELLEDSEISDGYSVNNSNGAPGGVVSKVVISATALSAGPIVPMADVHAPKFVASIPETGEVTETDRPEVNFTYSDNGSGFAGAYMILDGKEISPAELNINTDNGAVSWVPSSPLPEGEYNVQVIAWDKAGNRAPQSSVIFRSPGQINADRVYLYPSPASDTMTINVRFNRVVDHIKLNIYDSTGRKVWSDIEYDTQICNFYWDLINSRGLDVANGTYLVKMKAVADKTIEIERTVSVLR